MWESGSARVTARTQATARLACLATISPAQIEMMLRGAVGPQPLGIIQAEILQTRKASRRGSIWELADMPSLCVCVFEIIIRIIEKNLFGLVYFGFLLFFLKGVNCPTLLLI